MTSWARATTDHDEIRRWAAQRGAAPARAASAAEDVPDHAPLCLAVPGMSGQGSLEPISWDQFFRAFDAEELALVYQERTATGERSFFCRVVRRAAL